MSSLLINLLSAITPSPVAISDDYNALEYRWKFLVFRPGLFVTQGYLLLGLLLYVAFALYGKYHNQRKANAVYDAILPLLTRNFSAPTSSSGLISDGPTDFFVFSTGRRALASLHTVLTLTPRQDPLQYLWQCLWQMYDLTYTPVDELTLDFLLEPETAAAVPDFVWAVVNKSELTTIKATRWDLTFTRTTEHASLPQSLSLMSEFADVTDAILKLQPSPSTTLPTLLATPPFLTYLRSLSVTDQPHERPFTAASYAEEKLKNKRVVLNVKLPSAHDAHELLPVIDAVFALVDLLTSGKVVLRPETKSKIKKIREDVEKDIKEEQAKEKREEAAEDKRNAKRKVEEERIANLSAAEQKKILERNQKRAIRKSQGKVHRK